MTRKDVTKYAPIAGAAGVALAFGLDAAELVSLRLWHIALAFPAGAFAYLFIEFLTEKVGA